MELEEYLEAIRNCPDEQIPDKELVDMDFKGIWRLTADFGVYDNYPIYLKVGFDKLISDLTNSSYELDSISNDKKGNRLYLLNYNPGSIVLQVSEKLGLGLLTEGSVPKGGIAKEHYDRIERDFDRGIVLHTYQKKKIPNVHWLRPLVMVIEDICGYAQRENLPLCLPKTSGISLPNRSERFERIVYHYP